MDHKSVKSTKEKKKWTVSEVFEELKNVGSEQTKKTYLRHGAREPLFGVTSQNLKKIMKKTGKDYFLALELYASGNYDAMYFAGMITEPKKMSKDDFRGWIKAAYCQGIADYTVAVTLAETSFAVELADEWLHSLHSLYRSAGWSCYCWLLGNRPDHFFNEEIIKTMLTYVDNHIHEEENRVKYAMNSFVIAVGISYIPLHEYAYEVADHIGIVAVDMGDTNCKTPSAKAYIKKAMDSNRIGFKRKHVRC